MARNKIKPKIELSPEQLNQTVTKVVQAQLFRGPMPSPELIKKYSELYPNAAEFFFSIMEKQTSHRIEMERSVIK